MQPKSMLLFVGLLLLAIFIGTICGCVETRVMSNEQLEMSDKNLKNQKFLLKFLIFLI